MNGDDCLLLDTLKIPLPLFRILWHLTYPHLPPLTGILIATQESTAQFLSFEWSHDQIFPAGLKVKFISIKSTQEINAQYLAGQTFG